MSIQLPPHLESIDERLASLEDPTLAERLVNENPSLYSRALAQIEEEAQRSTSRRFGSFVLAITATASIVAGYFLMPVLTKQQAPPAAPAVRPPVVVGAPRPAGHHHVAGAPAHVIRHGAIVKHMAQSHAAVRPIPVAPVFIPVTAHHDGALRAKLAAEQAEVARLRMRVAAQEAAARHARAKAAAAASAVRAAAAPRPGSRPQTEPQPQTRDESAVGQSTTQGTADPATARTSPTTNAPAPGPETQRSVPPSVGGVPPWSEHFPTGPLGPRRAGVPADTCTPSGGRVGIVLNAILSRTQVGQNLRF